MSWWPCCATNMLCFGWDLSTVFIKDIVKRENPKKKKTISLKKRNRGREKRRGREKERDITNESLFHFAEAKNAEWELV